MKNEKKTNVSQYVKISGLSTQDDLKTNRRGTLSLNGNVNFAKYVMLWVAL